jgi:transcriptional regulator with XRE-family HTH domain
MHKATFDINYDKPVGDVIRAKRLFKGMTVSEFKIQLSVHGSDLSLSYINQIELHGEIPSVKVLNNMATILNIDRAYLIEISKANKRKAYEKVLEFKYPELAKE